jgi:hypothetical protein
MQTWAGRVAQMVEHLPSECEVLSSNPTKKKIQAYGPFGTTKKIHSKVSFEVKLNFFLFLVSFFLRGASMGF